MPVRPSPHDDPPRSRPRVQPLAATRRLLCVSLVAPAAANQNAAQKRSTYWKKKTDTVASPRGDATMQAHVPLHAQVHLYRCVRSRPHDEASRNLLPHPGNSQQARGGTTRFSSETHDAHGSRVAPARSAQSEHDGRRRVRELDLQLTWAIAPAPVVTFRAPGQRLPSAENFLQGERERSISSTARCDVASIRFRVVPPLHAVSPRHGLEGAPQC